ncbi:HNH endonuclease [Corynebacterium sp. TA-R-1]|uniref:HNH endonuclease n=1 Tax=Corynebacterium stercoris TaxID=2943490 RepID=A0ABT1FZV1_9CORY|nr:HNH endonuclease signature motif containing protein [Corynebacterium stercoris]MCP1387291.1 HNH endonuclease [Corynebacterium stercoris]
MNITQLVDDALAAMSALADAMEDPSQLHFDDIHEDLERFESVTSLKAITDVSFAFICDRDGAGTVVGATYANEYLKRKLGLSKAEAASRLSRARDMYGPEPEPENEPETEAPNVDTPGAEEQPEPSRKEKNRKNSRSVSEEKQRIINRALMGLTAPASCERQRIFDEAMAYATTHKPEDVRRYTERLVKQANAAHAAPDPNATWAARSVGPLRERNDGMFETTILFPPGDGALWTALTEAGNAPGVNFDGPTQEDSRTPNQRRYDQLRKMLTGYEDSRQTQHRGAASVVLSITLDDVESAGPDTAFPTNTGIDLTATDLLRLGLTGTDFIVQFDRLTHLPLSMGRARLATVHQRIALLAMQGVCAWTGCSKPFTEAEIHHIIPYIEGGPTDIENLIGLCRQHHGHNNDRRDGANGRHHVDRDPATGRVGVVAPDGSIEFNESLGTHDAAGSKLRQRAVAQHRPAPTEPDPPLFPVAEPPGGSGPPAGAGTMTDPPMDPSQPPF